MRLKEGQILQFGDYYYLIGKEYPEAHQVDISRSIGPDGPWVLCGQYSWDDYVLPGAKLVRDARDSEPNCL